MKITFKNSFLCGLLCIGAGLFIGGIFFTPLLLVAAGIVSVAAVYQAAFVVRDRCFDDNLSEDIHVDIHIEETTIIKNEGDINQQKEPENIPHEDNRPRISPRR